MSLEGDQDSPGAIEKKKKKIMIMICHSIVYHCVHNVQLLVPILCQMDPVPNAPIQYVKLILILSSRLIRDLHSGILH
jgi:hypothetical protein